jgi:hypothetical protein
LVLAVLAVLALQLLEQLAAILSLVLLLELVAVMVADITTHLQLVVQAVAHRVTTQLDQTLVLLVTQDLIHLLKVTRVETTQAAA